MILDGISERELGKMFEQQGFVFVKSFISAISPFKYSLQGSSTAPKWKYSS